MENKLKEYQEKGYIVIDDFLPEEQANKLNALYVKEQNWEQIDQVREKHYQHVFATKSEYLPKGDEFYMAKFGRSRDLEKSETVNEIYDKYFKPQLNLYSGTTLKAFDIRCYYLKPGDFYRSHIDDYAGSIGCVYYLNKKWIWDWGGLLHINSYEGDANQVETIFPKFNRAVLLDHKKFKFPHFVSVVSEFAKEPRYSIVSFNG
jgi:Rps23 Pro-64 3,4-dihydroxylase Tpa1-like proline 4-hydroxylase